jgi:dienelactone hydrolase
MGAELMAKKHFLQALAFLTAALLTLAGASAHAAWVEKIIMVPVKVTNAYGKVIEQEVVVSVYHDSDAAQPYPIALINHGRAARAEERAAFGRATSITNARWLAAMGFLVVVPTRIGYGVSGGEDAEDTGDCGRKNYPPGYEAAAAQTLQVLDIVKQRPDVAPNRTLILGQSFGGATAIAVAAKNPPGVLAAINFAGGGGGNPVTQPQEPCGTSQLRRMFADYGHRARIPTLWIYTENDQWMGPKYPREWFGAFKAEGGVGEFVQFPPHGKDGHGLFTQAPEVWRPTALSFLQANGFADLTVKAQGPR